MDLVDRRYMGLALAQPARRVGVAALADRRRRPAAGRRRASARSCSTRSSRSSCGARRLENARLVDAGTESFGESLSYFPAAAEDDAGPRRYLSLLERAAAAVDVPVIGSLNGVTPGGWVDYARAMQDAGAAAIELNIYYLPGDPRSPAATSSSGMSTSSRGSRTRSPSPSRSSSARTSAPPARWPCGSTRPAPTRWCCSTASCSPTSTRRRWRSCPEVGLSSPAEARLPRTWIALLHGRVRARSQRPPASRRRPTSPSTCSPAPTS